MPNSTSRFSLLARAFFRRVEAMRTLIVPALVLGLLAVPASSAHAQMFVKNFDVPRRELRAGTFGFNAYFPPPYDEYYTEAGEPGMEIWWLGMIGARDAYLTVWPIPRTLYAGLTRDYYLRYDCPFCVSGQVYTYAYHTRGPVNGGLTPEFLMRMSVTTFPLGAPCTKGDECINEACIDGFCCNWQCGAGVGDPNNGAYSAAPCMACSVARGATAPKNKN